MTISAQTLTACYFGDVILVDQNEPPEIIESTTDDAVLVIDLERFPVYVACDDDTDDVLEYFWIKGLEPVPDAVQITKGSMIWLDREEPGLDGKELRVTIYDSEAASTSQSWIVEVP